MQTAPHKKDLPIFYVYEHWRPDTEECFWVGKGHGGRAYLFKGRNEYHRNVVKLLKEKGLRVDVRIVADGLFEREALDFEKTWILFWRNYGQARCNLTDGGEGVCGLVHSSETRAVLSRLASEKLRGRPVSEETREKIAAAQRGRPRGPNPEHAARLRGRKLTEEHKAKIGAGGKGRIDPPGVRKKRAESNRGRKVSKETRRLLSLSHLGHTQSEETRAKRSASLKLAWAKRKAASNG